MLSHGLKLVSPQEQVQSVGFRVSEDKLNLVRYPYAHVNHQNLPLVVQYFSVKLGHYQFAFDILFGVGFDAVN